MYSPLVLTCFLLAHSPNGGAVPSAENVDAPRSADYVQSLKSRDSFVARAAVEKLIQMGPPATGLMIEALQSEDVLTRQRAAYVLSHIGPTSPDQVRVLIATLQDPDVEVRRRAALALGRAKVGEGAVAALVAALKDRDLTVRLSAAVALGDIAPESVDAKTLTDERRLIAKTAREAIRKFMSQEQQRGDHFSNRKGAKP